MITTIGEIRQSRREMKSFLKELGLYEQFLKLKRKISRNLELDVMIYKDTCPEWRPDVPIYIAEIYKDIPFGLVHTIINTNCDEVLREMEEYINE